MKVEQSSNHANRKKSNNRPDVLIKFKYTFSGPTVCFFKRIPFFICSLAWSAGSGRSLETPIPEDNCCVQDPENNFSRYNSDFSYMKLIFTRGSVENCFLELVLYGILITFGNRFSGIRVDPFSATQLWWRRLKMMKHLYGFTWTIELKNTKAIVQKRTFRRFQNNSMTLDPKTTVSTRAQTVLY